jgi:prepilin-type N-terminal cleavage/methylation domain-containing protein
VAVRSEDFWVLARLSEGACLKQPVTEPKRSQNPKRPLSAFSHTAWLQNFLKGSKPGQIIQWETSYRQAQMKRGFTLLELLVVIAIIAILAALLLPVVDKAKSAAQKTACINNLSEINAALRMYADDHADAVSALTNGAPIYFTYKDSLGPYLSRAGVDTNDALFACPADNFNCNDPGIKNLFPFNQISGTGFYRQMVTDYSSYFFNGTAETNEAPRLAQEPFSAVRQPSELVLAGELSAVLGLSTHSRNQPYQFNNAMNVLSFVDGHVGCVRIYWDGVAGIDDYPVFYNPPEGYEYKWLPIRKWLECASATASTLARIKCYGVLSPYYGKYCGLSACAPTMLRVLRVFHAHIYFNTYRRGPPSLWIFLRA